MIFICFSDSDGSWSLVHAAEIASSTSAGLSIRPVASAVHQTSPAENSCTRHKAWCHMSYADLITQAITNTPEQRLTLSQIYDWIVQNVDSFREKQDNNSSAGWKVS